MNNEQLTALCNGLIALCQRNGLLPTVTDDLVDELKNIASDECIISDDDLLDFLS